LKLINRTKVWSSGDVSSPVC